MHHRLKHQKLCTPVSSVEGEHGKGWGGDRQCKRIEGGCTIHSRPAMHAQELRPSPFEGARKGFSADAEVGRSAASGDFSGRQSLGGEQTGRRGIHRKTLSLPAHDLDMHRGRPVDHPRLSHPGTRRSHSLQQHIRERFSLHRGSRVRPCRCCQHMTLLSCGGLPGMLLQDAATLSQPEKSLSANNSCV